MERNLLLQLDVLRKRDEPVDELLAEHLLDDVLVVVVAQGARQFVVVHVRLLLAKTPQLGDLFGVHQLELAVIAGPCDDLLVLAAEQELQKKLPKRYVGLHGVAVRVEREREKSRLVENSSDLQRKKLSK